jgi:hypothetical protein
MARADSADSYLGRRKQIEGLLISGVGPLQIITHEITMTYERRVVRGRAPREGGNERTEGAPHFPIVVLQLNNALEVIDRLGAEDYISTKKVIGTEPPDRGRLRPTFW